MAHLEPLRLLEHLRGSPLPEEGVAHLERCPTCRRRLEKVRAMASAFEEIEAQERAESDRGVVGDRHRRKEQLRDRAELSAAAQAAAAELVAAAAEGAADEILRSIREHPARGFILAYGAQKGARLAVTDPHEALGLALLIKAESGVPDSAPVHPKLILGEALLLESQALLNLGDAQGARQRPQAAREAFREAGPDRFGEALCDYFEGSALAFANDYPGAERLLRRSVKAFAEFGQEQWLGRAELALGTLLSQRGDDERAVGYLEQGRRRLDPVDDANALAAGLLNLGSVLAHIGRRDEALANYARALEIAKKNDFRVLTHHIQLGLAEADFLEGRYARALDAYRRLTEQARGRGYREQVRFALLYTAECLARLGQQAAADGTLRELKREIQEHPFQSVALEDLFACLDQGDVDAGLIAAVRGHLERPEAPYQARCAG